MASIIRGATTACLALFLLAALGLAGIPPGERDVPSAAPAGSLRIASPGPVLLNVTPWDGETIGTATPVILVVYGETNPLASIAAVDFHLDGMNLTSAGAFNASAFVLPLALELRSGPHLANFTVLDSAGESASIAWSFTVDTVPPILLVTAPIYPIVPTSLVQVEGTAVLASPLFAGAAPINVTATVLPSHASAWTLVPPDGSFSLAVPLTEGVNMIFVNATDRVGNFATEITSVVRDTVRPSLVVVSPTNLSVSPTSVVRVSGLSEFGAYLTVNGFSVAVAPNGTWSVDLALPEGPQAIVVVAADAVGNTNIVLRVVLVDSDVPQIQLTSPLVPLTNRSRVQVSGYASDSQLVAVLVNLVSVPFDPATGYFSTNLTLADGLNPIVVVAVDAAQHRGIAQTGILVDTTAAVVRVTGPPSGVETNQSTMIVSGAIDDGNATVLVNGQSVRPNPDGTWRTTVALVQGANSVVVSSVDVAGNRGAQIRILATFYPPWYGLDDRIAENANAFGIWGSTLSLGLAGVLIFLTALILLLYLRLDRRIVRLRGTRPEVPRPGPSHSEPPAPPPETKAPK